VSRIRSVLKRPSVSVGLTGPSVSSDLGLPRTPGADTARTILETGALARRTARPALLVIDDLQEWSRSEIRALCRGLNECADAGQPPYWRSRVLVICWLGTQAAG
jgi:hypothetical protein